MTTATIGGVSVWRRFTAVDYVTLAVFAALYRALWYVWSAFAFIFPFNQVINAFFSIMAVVACLVIVRKVGAATLMVVAAQLINLFLQGEALAAALVYCSWGILADVYVYFRLKAGVDPFNSLKEMFIAGALAAIFRVVSDWFVAFPLIFLTPIEPSVLWAIVPAHYAGGVAGGAFGFWLGNRVKGLIG